LNKHKRYRACCNNENHININILLKKVLALNKRIYTENKCNFTHFYAFLAFTIKLYQVRLGITLCNSQQSFDNALSGSTYAKDEISAAKIGDKHPYILTFLTICFTI